MALGVMQAFADDRGCSGMRACCSPLMLSGGRCLRYGQDLNTRCYRPRRNNAGVTVKPAYQLAAGGFVGPVLTVLITWLVPGHMANTYPDRHGNAGHRFTINSFYRRGMSRLFNGLAHKCLAALRRRVDIARYDRPGRTVGMPPRPRGRRTGRDTAACKKLSGARIIALTIYFYVCSHANLFNVLPKKYFVTLHL